MTHSDPAGEGADDDERGLAIALSGLSRLVSGRDTLEGLLTRVADFAVQAVPGADGAGVTMLERGQQDTMVASAPFVTDVDRIQYRLGEGPCISAATSGRTNGSPALGEDAMWPTFGPLAAELGVRSALSLALVLDGEILGALNVYARARGAFTDSSRQLGELFAGTAAVAVHNARILDEARQTAIRLERALTTRATIDRAVGIVMSRSGLSADDAFARLRMISQREHVKLSMVATRLVDQAVHKARAGRATDCRR